MADDPMSDLASELGAKPPGGLGRLETDQLNDLAEAVQAARRRQAAALAAAAEQSLRHIPGILRVPVRKVFGA